MFINGSETYQSHVVCMFCVCVHVWVYVGNDLVTNTTKWETIDANIIDRLTKYVESLLSDGSPFVGGKNTGSILQSEKKIK